MGYTEVSCARPAQLRVGPVWTVSNGVFPSNCYLCATGVSNECFIVDPGLDAAPIEAALDELHLTPRAVLCTHGHFDHTGTAAHFQKQYGCSVHLHERDLKTLRSSNFLLMAFNIPRRILMPDVQPVTDIDPLVRIGNVKVRFHALPGHTPGSCAIEYADSLYTGDTLYRHGVGLSKLPGEDAEQLRRSIQSIWNRFSDDTIIRPGHGDSAAFGWIKQNNTALLSLLHAVPSILAAP